MRYTGVIQLDSGMDLSVEIDVKVYSGFGGSYWEPPEPGELEYEKILLQYKEEGPWWKVGYEFFEQLIGETNSQLLEDNIWKQYDEEAFGQRDSASGDI